MQLKVIEIKNLSFAYDNDIILENINLIVNKLDFLAIIGPNGGGKSTLLKLMLNLVRHNKDDIYINPKYKIGYVPQNTNVNINFPITVLDVVMMGIKSRSLFGYTKSERANAIKALKRVGVNGYEHERIGSLSGGQRQRVMIARALSSNPHILMLDEPTSSIDAKGQKEIYELLKELNKEITIIVVSHDISITMQYATKVAYINKTLTYHDMSKQKNNFSLKPNEHFCEVELLHLLSRHK